jgi:putative heme-binding domain-containing protein
MRRVLLVGLAVIAVAFPVPADAQKPRQKDPYAAHIAPTGPRKPAEQQKMFHLPEGFEIQLVASEPDIKKPINIAFDAKGRLWVTQSEEYPFPAKPGTKSRDAVKVLSDFQPDGRASKITTFADDLNIPIGVLPVKNGAIVYSIPNIWLLEDTDGDGKADRKQELYGTYGYQDTHGMTGEFMWGFDGWIYVCHGYANTSTVKAKDGSSITMQSGNTYRIKPDGSRVEPWTFGQVNPFGLAFDPLGNLYSCDCHSRPIYQLLRGAYYPSFGKPHDGIGFGPEMMTHSHGSTALAGIAYYAATQFPPEYRDNLFIGNVITHRINRDALERRGSTYVAVEKPDLVRCDDPWFRPVDIKLGPDGALYVADFYTKIIGHYEVPLDHPQRDNQHGRIWRIVYRGKDGQSAPPPSHKDYSRMHPAQLVGELLNSNLTVRMLVANQLVERGGQEGITRIRQLLDTLGFRSYEQYNLAQAHGLWVLERLGVLDDERLNKAAGARAAEVVRVHALRIFAERAKLTAEQRRLVVAALNDRDAFVQRAAAEALGRHPDGANLRPLFELWLRVPAADTHLLHAVRMAVRDQLKHEASWKAVTAGDWDKEERRTLADVIPGVPRPEAAAFLMKHLEGESVPFADTVRFVHHVARYGEGDSAARLLKYATQSFMGNVRPQAEVFKAIQRGTQERGQPLDAGMRAWGEQLTTKLLATDREKDLLVGIELAGSLKAQALQGQLSTLLLNAKASEAVRKAAASALAAIQPKDHLALLGRLLADPREPMPLREHLAGALGGTNLGAARAELVRALQTAPSRLETVIAVALAGSREGAEKLLELVEQGKASARLLQERVVEVRLRQAKVPNLKDRLVKLTRGLPAADEALAKLLDTRRAAFVKARPDVAAGAKVYEKHCATCHQVANQGAKIGPQLDGIGLRGLDRLLEDLLDPNRNVDQAFRSTVLTLKDGRLVTGLLLREEGAVLVLADAQGKEVRVEQGEVMQKTHSSLSPMPANFADQISGAEFTDLLAYLLEQRLPPPQEKEKAKAGPDTPSTTPAQDADLRKRAEEGMKKATEFFRKRVATEGGYLWRYSEDLKRREGEAVATDTMVWVQPPGTPSVGLAYLGAYEATGDPYYLQAARETAMALVKGQLRSGGWDYRIEFDSAKRKKYAYRVDTGSDKGFNGSTLDDNNTQAALRLLMRVDRALQFKDAAIHEAVEYGLNSLLRMQYPNGAWPQRFDAIPDPKKFPVKKAGYPESWPKTFPAADYRGYYTFNDNSIADVIDVLLEAADLYREPKYRAAVDRAGDFILLAQMPEPQPGWAQQYDLNMHPAWARKFEPPAVTGGESRGVLKTLLRLYRETGDKKYLEPIPRALDYYRRSRLPDGRLARFYELKTNRPLYLTKDYQLTYKDNDLPTHYSFKTQDWTDAIAREYEQVRKLDPAKLKPTQKKDRPSLTPGLIAQTKTALASLDAESRWVENGRLRYHGADDPTRRVIATPTFIRNLEILSNYLAATKG